MPDPNYAERAGAHIGAKWRLDALVGIGGMAAVYAATHRNGRRAALKILKREFLDQPEERARFLAEGVLANRISHPGIVHVFDDDITQDGEPYLVIELLEGETLRETWRRLGKKVDVKIALHIADALLDCLSACHDAGIVHRDLKPANVFLTKSGRLKIIDFGVALAVEHAAIGRPLVRGTPAYMSPEQAMGREDLIDARADVFAVGAILHALVTGERLHVGRTEKESLLFAATRAAPTVALMAPDLPASLIFVIDKAIAWNREDRFASARDMRTAVLTALSYAEEVEWHELAGLWPSFAGLRKSRPLLSVSMGSIAGLLAAFSRLEIVFSLALGHGWEDPATQRELGQIYHALERALRLGDGLTLEVKPEGLVSEGKPLWTPSERFSRGISRLVQADVRSLTFLPRLGISEFQDLLETLLATDSECDVGIRLWLLDAPHIRLTFGAGQPALPSGAKPSLPIELGVAERALVGHEVGESEAHIVAFAMSLILSEGQGVFDDLIAATTRRARERNGEHAQEAFRRSLVNWFCAVVLALYKLSPNSRAERSARELGHALFGEERLLRYSAMGLLLKNVLDVLDERSLGSALTMYASETSVEGERLLQAFVQRHGSGHEAPIIVAADQMAPGKAYALLNWAWSKVAGRRAFDEATRTSSHFARAFVRFKRGEDLATLLSDPDAESRVAILSVLEHSSGERFFDMVLRALPDIHDKGELYSWYRALMLLSPRRAEPTLVEIATKSGLLQSQERVTKQIVACEVLGEIATMVESVKALREMASGFFRSNEELRHAALESARKIETRCAEESA